MTVNIEANLIMNYVPTLPNAYAVCSNGRAEIIIEMVLLLADDAFIFNLLPHSRLLDITHNIDE